MVKALNCRRESDIYMSNIYNIVSELGVRNGETKRMNCPACNGYKTFTVTNNMGSLMWNCYKVSCSVSGGSRVHLTVDDIKRGFVGAEESKVALSKTVGVPSLITKGRLGGSAITVAAINALASRKE